MFQLMEKSLIQSKLYTYPIVYISPGIDKIIAQKIKEIVRRRSGQIVENEENATHILYNIVESPVEEYGRPVLKRDKMVLMHWYYFPDSFDTWVNVDSVGLEGVSIESPCSKIGPWHITYAWIFDTDQYNEWMSEEDYEVDETGRKKIHPRLMSIEDLINPADESSKKKRECKRKRSPSPSSKIGKRKSSRGLGLCKKSSRDDEPEDLTKDMEDPLPDTLIMEVSSPNSQGLSKKDSDMKNSSVIELDESEDKTEENSQTGKTSDSNNQDEGLEDNVTEQTHYIIIPSYSSWFDYNSIHEIEKRAMGEFFNSRNKSKTPEIYMAYRFLLKHFSLVSC